MAAPRIHRAAPQQFARPSRGSPAAIARRAPATSKALASQRQERNIARSAERRNAAIRDAGRRGLRDNLARQRDGDNLVRQRDGQDSVEKSTRLGRDLSPQNQSRQTFQLAGDGKQGSRRALRNQFLASKAAAAGPAGRALARATFQGKFAGHHGQHWAARHGKDWKKHRHFAKVIVIGWVGPLFWPYAYDDFVDYTFYPYAYDVFWPYAYDEVYEGMFGGYAYGAGPRYAAIGTPQGDRGGRAGRVARGAPAGRAVGADLCSGETAGLTDWPIERIAQTVEPDDAQRAALDGLRSATARALDILKAACPTELPSTPTGRLDAMHKRLAAMLEAVRIVRPALETFYQSLNDEQKARFNSLGGDERADPQQARRDLAQACNERASGFGNLPIDRIERAVRPSEPQRAVLKELEDATAAAVELLKSECPTYRALTPVGRLEAMEQRLDAMLRAVQTVQPVLEKFYSALSDEQKERFNRLGPAQG
jgi:hypothetical protein